MSIMQEMKQSVGHLAQPQMYLPYLLLTTGICRHIRRIATGLTLDREHLLFDVISNMNFKVDYLAEPSTKKYFREEHLLPRLFPRESYESWQSRGENEEEIAIAETKKILGAHEVAPLPGDVSRELDRIAVVTRR